MSENEIGGVVRTGSSTPVSQRTRWTSAVWMTAVGTVFLLIGGIAVAGAVAGRYGARLATVSGIGGAAVPLSGAWELSERAPALKEPGWAFSSPAWTEDPSGVSAATRQFHDDLDQCTLVLDREPVLTLPVLVPDRGDTEQRLGQMRDAVRTHAAHAAHVVRVRDAWVPGGADGAVQLAGTRIDYTPAGGNGQMTIVAYGRAFKASGVFLALVLRCPTSSVGSGSSLVSDTLRAASLIG